MISYQIKMSEVEVAPSASGQSVSEGGESAEAAVLELERKITEAFLVFDTQENKQADVREVGTIIRFEKVKKLKFKKFLIF